ncbi:hypothetical protein Scep_000129 [Stephania cephalantha]|uniref:Uncharacterized protein n=1 Tax=Stephania cephalantha TaxID=152367 RepID=A0AAP0L5J4_9MAGN
MIDFKVSGHKLANTGTDSPNDGKQQQPAGKKAVLRDLQNDNRIMVPKPICSPPFIKDKSPIAPAIKVSGNKRLATECLPNPICHQYSSGCNPSGQLVYARRKSEQDLLKSSQSEDSHGNLFMKKICHQEQGAPQQLLTPIDGLKSCFPAFAPMPRGSLMTLSSVGPSVPLMGRPVKETQSEESKHFATTVVPHQVHSLVTNTQNWRERFNQLQAYLKNCDQSNQDEYIQMLRSLSSTGRSKQAVELEKRAIHLLLEEGKELQRMRVLNVLGKAMPKNSEAPSAQEVSSAKPEDCAKATVLI